tara:strand:- start:462 stop:2279 length:1818 start_codon:yes stop_codon:yes gene_type:complete
MAKKISRADKSRQLTSIKYTSRDYQTIKDDLVEYAKRYYSDSFKDFNDASFGALMLDTVAYVGDILSFYLDYQANESFIDTSLEFNNVIRHGKNLGYKFQRNFAASGMVSLYIMVPATSVGQAPDTKYMPILKRGAEFSSKGGALFTLTGDVDFSDPKNQIVVAKVNASTGVPTHYAIKAQGQVLSGRLQQELVNIGEFQKFLRLKLTDINITEVVSIFDSEGHQYFEVDYLSQNMVHVPVPNRSDRSQATSVLKPVPVPRRFTVEHEIDGTYVQFGYGSDSEIFNDSVADPSELILQVHGRNHITDASLDPGNLIATDKFGIAPSNTVLTIVYRTNANDTVNTSVNGVNAIVSKELNFENRNLLDSAKLFSVIDSLEVANEERIMGSVTLPELEDMRQRVKDSFAAQNRAVTKQDYLIAAYSMPAKFGAIKKCSIIKDHDSFKRNLNMYVISQDQNNNLVQTNMIVKQNLKTWLNGYKMINDTIDILDAKIANFGIEFTLLGTPGMNKYDVLNAAVIEIREEMDIDYDIGQSINITNIFKVLNAVPGVVDTLDVKITSNSGAGYSGFSYNIENNTTSDGRTLLGDEDVIFELKYPNVDIRGTVK